MGLVAVTHKLDSGSVIRTWLRMAIVDKEVKVMLSVNDAKSIVMTKAEAVIVAKALLDMIRLE